MTAKDHNKLLSVFLLVHGGLQAFGGIFVALVYGGIGVSFLSMARKSDEKTMGGIFLVLSLIIAPIILIMAGVFLMAGWKLLKEKMNARTWGIVASSISLLSFPLGTALGIYGLWFLLGEQGKQSYSGEFGANNFPPLPSNNWQ
jgi:hypothetical protein